MSILDELKAEEERLRGIRAPRGEGNGYNMDRSGRKLATRVRETARQRKESEEGEE